jgi:hypothetical protein
LMVVAPKENVGLPSEAATGLLSGGSVVELLDGSLLQPTITMVADMTSMMIAFFIKRNAPNAPQQRPRAAGEKCKQSGFAGSAACSR